MALATTRENILEMLDKKLKIPGKVFHNYYKYTSDIRGKWQENILETTPKMYEKWNINAGKIKKYDYANR